MAERDHVLAGIAEHHELLGLRSAHGAGVGFDGDVAEAAAIEDLAIDAVVFLVADVKAGFIHVEAVGVLHDEFADAQQAGAGAGFVAELSLNLIPDLRKLFVAVQLFAGDHGHHLFFGHAEAEVALEAVLEAEEIAAHDLEASAGLPDFGGVNGGQVELLADGVHFLADNVLDLEQRAPGQRQEAVDAGAELADVAGAEQENVARHLGIGRRLTQSGDKGLGPTHE